MMVQKLFADVTMALEDLHSVAVEGVGATTAPQTCMNLIQSEYFSRRGLTDSLEVCPI